MNRCGSEGLGSTPGRKHMLMTAWYATETPSDIRRMHVHSGTVEDCHTKRHIGKRTMGPKGPSGRSWTTLDDRG